MTAHPVDVLIVDGANVDKAGFRSFEKLRHRLRLADATEVRNTDLSGQFGGLYVRSLQAQFDLDTSDTTTADDGVNTIIDLSGGRFKRVAIALTETQRKITAAGAVTLAADAEDVIVIAKTSGAATTVNLPSAATRTKKIRIVDGKYDAGTNNITILPNGSETVLGTSSYVIDSNGSSITLTPLADGSGWV